MRNIKFRLYDSNLKQYLSEGYFVITLRNGINSEDKDFIAEQFSGLYDKNGKEIYEGDILRWYDNIILYVVTFEHGMFYASIKECNEGMIGGFSLHRLTKYNYRKCEIVGNIHDNPELLKGGMQ